MKPFSATLLLLLLPALLGCDNGGFYRQKAKTLDSLNGALNLKVQELEKADTALLRRCVTRYTYYIQFIKQGVNDTLSKSEADHLNVFHESGRKLENFYSNRLSILSRASLMNAQQNKLAKDIQNKLPAKEELQNYLEQEKGATTQLINAAAEQQKMYYSAIEEFKLSLKEVEALIRKRNRGQLPLIIKDTLAL